MNENINLERIDGENLEGYLERMDEHVQKLRWQSEGHRQWYTHKNPYGCWICELLQVTELIRDNSLDEIRNPRQSVNKRGTSAKPNKRLSSRSSKLKT